MANCILRNYKPQSRKGTEKKTFTNPRTTFQTFTDPPTTFHLPTDPTIGCHELTLKQRPDSTYVLQSVILQNFHHQLAPAINEKNKQIDGILCIDLVFLFLELCLHGNNEIYHCTEITEIRIQQLR